MSEVKHEGRQVEASIEIAAPVERVWEAWVDPEHIAGWFVDAARNRAQAGGSVVWAFEGFGEFSQQVLVADANQRLVLQAFPGALLEVRLSSRGGSTTITVVNSGFSDAAEMDEPMAGVGSGWQLAIAVLKEYVERHMGQRKQRFFHLRPSPLAPLDAQSWFTEERKLAAWLTRSGKPAAVGASATLPMQDGRTVHARSRAPRAKLQWSSRMTASCSSSRLSLAA